MPNARYPGVVTTLPDDSLLADVLARETQLLDLGGADHGAADHRYHHV